MYSALLSSSRLTEHPHSKAGCCHPGLGLEITSWDFAHATKTAHRTTADLSCQKTARSLTQQSCQLPSAFRRGGGHHVPVALRGGIKKTSVPIAIRTASKHERRTVCGRRRGLTVRYRATHSIARNRLDNPELLFFKVAMPQAHKWSAPAIENAVSHHVVPYLA